MLRPGDLQWMTAGRGIVHSEMPGWDRTRGLQLWVNLASEYKMVEPQYQELTSRQIPTANKGKVLLYKDRYDRMYYFIQMEYLSEL